MAFSAIVQYIITIHQNYWFSCLVTPFCHSQNFFARFLKILYCCFTRKRLTVIRCTSGKAIRAHKKRTMSEKAKRATCVDGETIYIQIIRIGIAFGHPINKRSIMRCGKRRSEERVNSSRKSSSPRRKGELTDTYRILDIFHLRDRQDTRVSGRRFCGLGQHRLVW